MDAWPLRAARHPSTFVMLLPAMSGVCYEQVLTFHVCKHRTSEFVVRRP